MILLSGRINRTTYFGGYCLYGILYLLLLLGTSSNLVLYGLMNLILNTAFLPFSVKRFHDLGASGWSAILLYIPILGMIMGGALMFQEGERKLNRYGQPPR